MPFNGKPFAYIPLGITFNIKEGYKRQHLEALGLMADLVWGSKQFRAAAKILTESNGETDVKQRVAEAIIDAPRALDHTNAGRVLVDGQIHRGFFNAVNIDAQDFDDVKTIMNLAAAEITQLTVEIVKMRSNTPPDVPVQIDNLEVLGRLTDTAAQDNPSEQRGDYSPLMIEVEWYAHLKRATLFFVTLDNIDEPPTREKTLAGVVTNMAVHQWINQRRQITEHQRSMNSMNVEFNDIPEKPNTEN